MTKVVAIMSMSLDGFVADVDDGVAEVFDWYFTSGDVELETGGADPMTFRVSEPSAEHLPRPHVGAGGRVHGADTIRQLLDAGLLDEICIDVAAVLLGSGVRLLDHLADAPVRLGTPAVTPGVGVTHLRYPVRAA